MCKLLFPPLQVTVTRDSSSNDYSLDAGALVLADQGVYHTYGVYNGTVDL